ncbi:putative Eisosome protein 1 [Halenospora varia]|nr:putative Eisosome protein 1 [Halenospora varia]
MTSFLGSNTGLGSFMSQTTDAALVPTGPIEDVKDGTVADGKGGHSNGVEERGASETTPLANHSHSHKHDFHEEKNPSSIKTEKPAKHTHSDRLEDQAATAALYVTKYDSGTSSGTNNRNGYDILDSDHKLSSAGAAASLKYAQPRDLPSYPSAGLKKDDSAAGAAASLGWANQKPFEHWKPDPSSSASTAAMRAKDYKMAPLWQPEDSAHGAKAALLAHRTGGKVEIWRPEPTTWGNSAATQAMGKKNTLSPQLDYGYTDIGRKGSLLAATGAMSSSRRRADSTPIPLPKVETYPDERNAAANALSAATFAHKSKRKTNISAEGGSVPFTTMPKEMYTSHPPVAPEVEEQNRQDMLRASAVAMAKQMYNLQQKQFDQAATHGATAAHGRRPSSAGSEDAKPMRFNNLQEAAQKLAQERLAKLHDEHAKNREYRDYYGHSTQPTSRLSIRGRTRRRASSDGNLDEDKEQSNKIRAQMSLFSSNLSQVDAKKRRADREALIAAAQRNVTKSLHGMDEKVFADTGKVAPSLMSDWEVKAHAATQAKSDTRMENYGKVHIGGGKFINQSAVDLVASRNVQPVLDEINEKAELERIRQAELKADQENERRKAAEKKAREKESKDIHKKLKLQDKGEEKLRKQEEKAARDEEKRAEKEKRKSAKVEAIPVTAATTEPATTAAMTGTTSNDIEATDEVASPAPVEREPSNTVTERREVASTPADIRTPMEDNASQRMRELSDAADRDQATTTSPTSPNSPRDGGKVKHWLKTKFARRSSKAQKPSKDLEKASSGFIGGAALTGASASNTSLGGNSASVREVALASSSSAARPQNSAATTEERGGKTERRASTISSMSSVSREGRSADDDGNGDEEFQEARDNFDEDLAPPPTFSVQKSSSPARSAKFTEEI